MTTANQTKKLAFDKAKACVLQFGHFDGKSLDQIAETDNGLRYLDNLRAKLESSMGYVRLCVETYLDDESIAKELQSALQSKRN